MSITILPKSLKYLPWIMAAMWFAARIIAGQFLSLDHAKNFGVLSNILLILLLIFLAIFYRYKRQSTEKSTFFDDLKDCMKPALKYVFASVLAIGLYYAIISDDVRLVREAYIQAFNEQIQDDANFEQFKKDHNEYANATREELIKTNMENVERNVSVQARVLGALLALTFVSLVYSLLAVFFWRTIVKRL